MKEIQFSEDQLNNMSEIGRKLFYEETDPSSPTYKRVLIRPQISCTGIVLHTLLPLALLVMYIIVLKKTNFFNVYSVLAGLAVLLIYAAICLKKAVLCCVKVYQRFAPDHIRCKCRFEPSCSQYMILAVEKYGVLKGITKGIKRLRRCNVNHGGYDYP